MRRFGGSSGSLLVPVGLHLVSQHYSTALPSPKRYDKRYEDRFLSRREPERRRFTYCETKRCMLVSVKLGADFSRWCALSAMQPPISTTHPHLTNAEEPEPCQGSGPKWITHRATVEGALALGRGKLQPAHCQSTARKPPTHHAQGRTHALQSIACRCAPRRNPLL
jgi:hypothetical protein